MFLLLLSACGADSLLTVSLAASDLQHFKDLSWVMLTASICSAVFVPLVSGTRILLGWWPNVQVADVAPKYSYLLECFGIRRMMFVAYGAFALGLEFWYENFAPLRSDELSSGKGMLRCLPSISGAERYSPWQSPYHSSPLRSETTSSGGSIHSRFLSSFAGPSSWHSLCSLRQKPLPPQS